MAKYIHADVDQYQIVTLNYNELFDEDHPIRKFFEIISEKLDLSAFDDNYNNDKGGRPAFPRERLLAILIYSLLYGNISMRNIERNLHHIKELTYYFFLEGFL